MKFKSKKCEFIIKNDLLKRFKRFIYSKPLKEKICKYKNNIKMIY